MVDAMVAVCLVHFLALLGAATVIRALETWLSKLAWVYALASWLGCGCGRRQDGQRAPVRSPAMDGRTPDLQPHDTAVHAPSPGAPPDMFGTPPATARGKELSKARWIWACRTVVRWIRIRRRWGLQGQSLQTIPFRSLWEHLDCRKYGKPTWAQGPKPQPIKFRRYAVDPQAKAAACVRHRAFRRTF